LNGDLQRDRRNESHMDTDDHTPPISFNNTSNTIPNSSAYFFSQGINMPRPQKSISIHSFQAAQETNKKVVFFLNRKIQK